MPRVRRFLFAALRYNEDMKSGDHDAEEGLSLPLHPDASGEESVLVETRNPTAEGLPLGEQPKRMMFGSAAGEFTMPDDFNDPLPKEIEDLFW